MGTKYGDVLVQFVYGADKSPMMLKKGEKEYYYLYNSQNDVIGPVSYTHLDVYKRQGDTLWDIAKKFYTTTEKIRELNDLKTENLTPMQQLLVERV